MTLDKLTMSVEWDLQRALGCGWRRGVRGGLVAERGHEIIAAGTTCRQVFWLSSGLTYRARPLCDGGQAILDVYLPGDFIGLDGLFFAPALDSVVALTSVRYWAIEHATLLRLMQKPEIALLLMRRVTEEKRRVDTIATLLGQVKARERTAALLLFLLRRLKLASDGAASEKGTSARLPLTQKQLADYLGLNVVHLNRTLSALRDGGVVRFENGLIVVHDAIQLEQIAGGAAEPP